MFMYLSRDKSIPYKMVKNNRLQKLGLNLNFMRRHHLTTAINYL